MKTRILGLGIGSLALAVGGLLILADRMQGRETEKGADSPTAESLTAYVDEVADAPAVVNTTNSVAQAVASNSLPSLLAQPTTPTGVKLSRGAYDITRFAQGGIGEDVMLAYIAGSSGKFNLGSDQIVYLNDIGVSGNVVKAMIQRDAALDAQAQAYAANQAAQSAPPVFTNPPPAPQDAYSQPQVDDTAMLPPPPFDSSAPQPGDDSQYFYDSLAPFGSWIYVAGCGVCWQPTVCVRNHDWRPYCDRGRWVYTNCGWYWQSDYSWGWAAFHYGRWFEHPRCGWVWCPEKVWAPAWVSWRVSGEHCGWAPLPPSAKYVPGSGFVFANHRVRADFEFGLQPRQYTYIPIARMSDYAPARYAAASWQAEEISKQTKVVTDVKEHNHRVVANGVDPKLVATLARTEIREMEIRDTPRAAQPGRGGDKGGIVDHHPQLAASDSRVALLRSAQTYPAGSVVLHGNGHAASEPATLAANASIQLKPTATPRVYSPETGNANQNVSVHVISGSHTAGQHGGETSAASSSPYRVYSTPPPGAAREEQPMPKVVPYVVSGSHTIAEHSSASREYPSLEGAAPSRTHNESYGGSSGSAHTHVESHAPTYSAPSSSHSSSSSQSSGSSSNHK